MAQTIVAQRGQSTVTGNGTTNLTLFTQSTGIATRVIINYVSAYMGSASTNLRISLIIDGGGTGQQACVAYAGQTPSGNSTGISMFPGLLGGPIESASGNLNQVEQYLPRAPNAVGSGPLVNIGTNQIRFTSQANTIDNSQPANIVPFQFWMNNGDVLLIRAFNQESSTMTVRYGFTTITES